MGGGEIRAAIPFFFALILVEWLVGGATLYRLNDSISDLGAGIGQQIFAVPLNALLVWAYAWIFRTTAVVILSIILLSAIPLFNNS